MSIIFKQYDDGEPAYLGDEQYSERFPACWRYHWQLIASSTGSYSKEVELWLQRICKGLYSTTERWDVLAGYLLIEFYDQNDAELFEATAEIIESLPYIVKVHAQRNDLQILIDWCITNFGPTLWEYAEGKWSMITSTSYPMVQFKFLSEEDATLFRLTWT